MLGSRVALWHEVRVALSGRPQAVLAPCGEQVLDAIVRYLPMAVPYDTVSQELLRLERPYWFAQLRIDTVLQERLKLERRFRFVQLPMVV